MAQYSIPGVIIEEMPATGPIQGLGTSTAGFIGPTRTGPIKTPTRITSWTQFKETFGGHIPRYHMANAVEGFFKNGGTRAYVVRVGTAKHATLDLVDRRAPAGNTLRVQALAEGTAGNTISIEVQDAQVVTGATALKAEAPMSSGNNNEIKLTSAVDVAKFRAGDAVTVEGSQERAVIERIQGDQLILKTNLLAAHNAGTVRIADLMAGQTEFRVSSPGGLETGSVIKIQQGDAEEFATVAKVQAGFVAVTTGLSSTYSMTAADPAVELQSFEFNVVVRAPSLPDETFSALSLDPRHSRYFGKVIASKSVRVRISEPPSSAAPPHSRPAVLAATNLTGGAADNIESLSATDYTDGIEQFVPVQDVNILAIPDRTDATVQQALISHCRDSGNRFAILDSSRGAALDGPGSVRAQRDGVGSDRGFAALYYPWLSIPNPQGSNGDTLLVPPSGFIAGVYARVDQERGVHKAPANEMIVGALGLERIFSETDMGILNEAGIDVIRTFPNRTRPTVWGARTTADDVAWRYINVRRLFLYVEESIKLGIRWSVFEPNDLALWEKLKRTIGEFLNRVWRSGALFGATAAEAYFVKCDEELNPPPVRALGQVFVEIGIAPVRPAEFVVIRIGMWDDGSQVSEG